jgi:predicted lactoylglutathione lyase
MEQRVSLVTLGVGDLARARRFYEQLGWSTAAERDADVVFFQAGGLIVGLWSRDMLAADSGVGDSGGWGGITLAYNADSKDSVDGVLREATAAGATLTRPASETFWGGYSGVFSDLDGHPWEVAYNPFWTLHPDGSVTLAR